MFLKKEENTFRINLDKFFQTFLQVILVEDKIFLFEYNGQEQKDKKLNSQF